MNDQTKGDLTKPQDTTAGPPAEKPKSQLTGLSVNVEDLSQAVKFAELMARSRQAVPKAFREEPGLCFAIVCKAMAWKMDPFAVAQNAYVVNDQVAYMAQIIKAAVDMHAPLEEPLDISFVGDAGDLQCVVLGKVITNTGQTVEREYISPRLRDIKVKNSPLWANDPEQQLGYYSVRSWARRHAPAILMGVYDKDELDQEIDQNRQARSPRRSNWQEKIDGPRMTIDYADQNTSSAPERDTQKGEAVAEGEEDQAPTSSPEASREFSAQAVIIRFKQALAEANSDDAANALFDELIGSEDWSDLSEEEQEEIREALNAKTNGYIEGEVA